MGAIHFQSVYRYCGLVVAEPLCRNVKPIDEPASPLRSEVTCPECIKFLLRLKESSHA